MRCQVQIPSEEEVAVYRNLRRVGPMVAMIGMIQGAIIHSKFKFIHSFQLVFCKFGCLKSCQYGERCKFQHAAPQQPKPNPFGFGSQSTNFQSTNMQQTKSNPFGFGVQSNSQPRGSNDLVLKQNQYKPFENKWTRSASTNSSSSRPTDNQPVASNHTCTDPESCRRQIVEDFNNEKPMWLLTCYGHRKNFGPCDITGDVSYEELRAAAYDDAKRGQSLTSIEKGSNLLLNYTLSDTFAIGYTSPTKRHAIKKVERERSLVNSKVAEFENLLRNPYASQSTSAANAQSPFPGSAPSASLSAQSPFPGGAPSASLSAQSPFPGAVPNASLSAQSSFPPSASSFSQLGAILNTGASTPPTNSIFGQPSPLGNSFKASSSSGAANAFSFGNTSGSFGFGSQVPTQSQQNPSIPSNNLFSTSTSLHVPNPSGGQLPTPSQGLFAASVTAAPASINLTSGASTEEFSGDNSIWTKNEWKIGEIPEEAPPDRYVY
ncbi:zinc finger CCCH domain-containing protein 16 isoform X1 [Lycium barbarum]|uniref:zinc finger CCCH domain-containing protein 16 isoform X1 n=2 Tax=Lycium barbarum TaxID=112863 RepID=UPI00293F3251|nr:zinc finger CCCH domain-containing protein 16 isoform X1 [Lycium barbarum]